MASMLGSVIDDEDWGRLKMGRFSDADERMITRMMQAGSGSWFSKLVGSGVDLRAPAVASSRPQMMTGSGSGGGQGGDGRSRQTLVFSHSVIKKGHGSPHGSPRGGSSARGGSDGRGGRQRTIVKDAPSQQGDSSRPGGQGRLEGLGASFSVHGSGVENGRGVAARFQAYMERPDAVEVLDDGTELSMGTLSWDFEDRVAYWDEVERYERDNGRTQYRVIAELPSETAVGGAGRGRIVARVGEVFDRLGIPWHAVVHVPPEGGDPRNVHLHLAYHDRPVLEMGGRGDVRFATRKVSDVWHRSFIPQLRSVYADLVNEELERAGVNRRVDPSRYEDAGVKKRPGVHLGNAASQKEREGVVTQRGRAAARQEMAYRCDLVAGRIAHEIRPVVTALTKVRSDLAGLARRQPETASARAGRLADAIEHVKAWPERKFEAAVAEWRFADLRLRGLRAAVGNRDPEVRRICSTIVDELTPPLRQNRDRARAEEATAKVAFDDASRVVQRECRSISAAALVERHARASVLLREARGKDALKDLEEGRMPRHPVPIAKAQDVATAAHVTASEEGRKVVTTRTVVEGLLAPLGADGDRLISDLMEPLRRPRAQRQLREAMAATPEGPEGAMRRDALERLRRGIDQWLEQMARADQARQRARRIDRLIAAGSTPQGASPEAANPKNGLPGAAVTASQGASQAAKVVLDEKQSAVLARREQRLVGVVARLRAAIDRNPLARRLASRGERGIGM